MLLRGSAVGDYIEEYESLTPDIVEAMIREDIKEGYITLYSPIKVHCYNERCLNGLFYAIDWLDKYKRYMKYAKS